LTFIKPKGGGKLLAKLLSCKEKLNKLALRECHTAKQFKDRIAWERVRSILIKRYDRYDD
jgi:hypothetical protein